MILASKVESHLHGVSPDGLVLLLPVAAVTNYHKLNGLKQHKLIILRVCLVVSNSMTPWTVTGQTPLSMGILQARILKWVAIPFSKGFSQPRDRTQVSCIAEGFFTS